MIVLDEQLLGRNLEREIAKWYRGKVLFVTDLRLNSVIKDDAYQNCFADKFNRRL